MSVLLGEVVHQAVLSIGKSWNFKAVVGLSVLGGAEKLGGGGGCGPTSGTTQLLIIHLSGNRWEMFTV